MSDKLLKTAALIGLVCGVYLIPTLTMAQEGRRADRRGRRQMTPEERQQRMEQFRKRMMDRVRERLGFTEEEWKVVEPRYEKVTELSRQMGGRMGRRFFGRRPGGRADDDRDERREVAADASPMIKARAKLEAAVENETTPAGQVQAAIKEYHRAREQAEAELAKARQALREVLSPRQEAMLMLMGTLD